MTTGPRPAKSVLVAEHDPVRGAVLDELAELRYALRPAGLPGHVRAASGVRRFGSRLAVVQDDVDALAVRDADGRWVSVALEPRLPGQRHFDDALGNKERKLDLEACVVLADDRFVAFGSGALPVRECVVVWDGVGVPRTLAASALYARLRGAADLGAARLNLEGAVVAGERLLLFHRANDLARGLGAILELDARAVARWLDGGPLPDVVAVTAVDLGSVAGVRLGFTDAVAIDADTIVVLLCAESSTSALTDGEVIGCRVGALTAGRLRTVDVRDANGTPTRLKLEGIERRAGSVYEFDVVADVDSFAHPAQLGRLTFRWQ